MSKTESPPPQKLRLLVDSCTGKILYAEANKTFVDFFFSLLTMPIGTVLKLLSSEEQKLKGGGCLMNIYKSVHELDDMYLHSADQKDQLLQPRFLGNNTNSLLKFESAPSTNDSSNGGTHYICNNLGSSYYTHSTSTARDSRCSCGCQRSYPVNIGENNNVSSASNTSTVSVKGFVKETVIFIVTDDLHITPASTIFSIMLLNKLNVKDVSKLKEHWTTVGFDEALSLMGASMSTKTVLNDVFGGIVCAKGSFKSTTREE